MQFCYKPIIINRVIYFSKSIILVDFRVEMSFAAFCYSACPMTVSTNTKTIKLNKAFYFDLKIKNKNDCILTFIK